MDTRRYLIAGGRTPAHTTRAPQGAAIPTACLVVALALGFGAANATPAPQTPTKPAPLKTAEAGPALPPMRATQPPRRHGSAQPRPPRREANTPASAQAVLRAANAGALATSKAEGFVNAAQLFAYEPGKVYEVWTAPLRITTVSLAPGETITAKAAGDTERWMIGETASGTGDSLQTHLLIKPFRAGLATNMVITTNRRVYLLNIRSGGSPEAFNAAVTWTHPAPPAPPPAPQAPLPPDPVEIETALLARLHQGYAIKPKGKRPAWTPQAVADDGTNTFITFPDGEAAPERPPILARDASGALRPVTVRHHGAVAIVDGVHERLELALSATNGARVRVERKGPR